MTNKRLVADFDTQYQTTIAATFVSGDVVYTPTHHNVVYVDTPTCAACTFTPQVVVGASYRDIPYDLDGNAYPRAAFTGDAILQFETPPGAPFKVTATIGTMYVQSAG